MASNARVNPNKTDCGVEMASSAVLATPRSLSQEEEERVRGVKATSGCPLLYVRHDNLKEQVGTHEGCLFEDDNLGRASSQT